MQRVNVGIEGLSPLLMNRFFEADIEAKPKRKSGESREPAIENKLYLRDEEPYIPAIYFARALIEAGKDFQIPKKGKSTYSKVIGAMIDVEPEALMLSPGEWEPFRISAVNPNTGGRIMVSRPRFEKWACEMELIIQDDAIAPSTMKEILDYAGKYVGVGDWRPAKKGKFGKFMVIRFESVR